MSQRGNQFVLSSKYFMIYFSISRVTSHVNYTSKKNRLHKNNRIKFLDYLSIIINYYQS